MNVITLQTLHDIVSRIEIKVDKTNGRVNKLEMWLNRIIGGLIITNLILLPALFIFLTNWIK